VLFLVCPSTEILFGIDTQNFTVIILNDDSLSVWRLNDVCLSFFEKRKNPGRHRFVPQLTASTSFRIHRYLDKIQKAEAIAHQPSPITSLKRPQLAATRFGSDYTPSRAINR